VKAVATNRRARFDYEITDTVLAGIILSGPEAKSCRLSQVDMSGSYVSFHGGKPVIKHLKISPYKFSSQQDGYDPGHDRQLLLNNNESIKLQELSDQKGVTIIPLEVQAGKYIKVLIGIGRGKKTIDKRRTIKERDVERRMRQGKEI
jgi:SsrA-binding protein